MGGHQPVREEPWDFHHAEPGSRPPPPRHNTLGYLHAPPHFPSPQRPKPSACMLPSFSPITQTSQNRPPPLPPAMCRLPHPQHPQHVEPPAAASPTPTPTMLSKALHSPSWRGALPRRSLLSVHPVKLMPLSRLAAPVSRQRHRVPRGTSPLPPPVHVGPPRPLPPRPPAARHLRRTLRQLLPLAKGCAVWRPRRGRFLQHAWRSGPKGATPRRHVCTTAPES